MTLQKEKKKTAIIQIQKALDAQQPLLLHPFRASGIHLKAFQSSPNKLLITVKENN